MSDLSKTSSSQTLVHMEGFFGEDRLLASKLIAVARLVGSALSESTCELIDPGVGDGGSSTIHGLAWPVAWASLLMLVVAVVVSAVFLGGMMGSEKVSRKQVEVSVQIYCYKLVTGGPMADIVGDVKNII